MSPNVALRVQVSLSKIVSQGVNGYLGKTNMLSAEKSRMKIDVEREEDGRWIAEVADLPGVMVYGQTRAEAISKVESLALRAIADRLDHA